jgi:hypothetical protein
MHAPHAGGVTVQMLGGENVKLSADAQQLKDWVEKGGHFIPFVCSSNLQQHAIANPMPLPSSLTTQPNPTQPSQSSPPSKHTKQTPPPGVIDAVRERYLKRLYFGVAADAECTTILEEFVFTFQYGEGEGGGTAMRLDAGVGGEGGPRATIDDLGKKANGQVGGWVAAALPFALIQWQPSAETHQGNMISIKHVKNQVGGAGSRAVFHQTPTMHQSQQGTRHPHTTPPTKPTQITPTPNPKIFRLMRTLVELCGTLEEVPEERHIFMRLTYHVRGVGVGVWAEGDPTRSMHPDQHSLYQPTCQPTTHHNRHNCHYCPPRTTPLRTTSRPTSRQRPRSRPTGRSRRSPSA